MNFLVDAQLPPTLSTWLNQQTGHFARHVFDLNLMEADDLEIFFYARQNDFTIVSKDSDFLDIVAFHNAPPKILFVNCGNMANKALIRIFQRQFSSALDLLNLAMPVVEIG